MEKNNRLIGEKPPNPVGTEEENHIIVQSPRINLRGQWYVELLPSQSTIVARVTPGRPHLTAFSQAKSPCYYSLLVWRIPVAPSRPVDSD